MFSYRVACPLFVPLVEEGMADHPATELIARGYLLGLKDKGLDNLILACTHFPILLPVIAKTMGDGVVLVESGPATARELKKVLQKRGLLRNQLKSTYEFYFTDAPEKAAEIARKMLKWSHESRYLRLGS